MKIHITYPEFSEFNEWEGAFLPTLKSWMSSSEAAGYVWTPDPSEADIIVLLESSTLKNKSHADELLKEPCLLEYPEKVFTVNYEDGPAGFLPGVYAALHRRKFDPGRHRSGPYLFPYEEEWAHRYYGKRNSDPGLLFSFRGYRSHPVRARIFDRFSVNAENLYRVTDTNRWYVHSDEDRHMYFSEILDSKFVLCPRGCSTTSYHLYEAMELGRCPVIIADGWVPPRRVPWEKFAIFVPETRVGHIPDILKERENEWQILGDEARRSWDEHFSPVKRMWYILDEIRDLDSSMAGGPRDYEHMWKSREFSKKNGWTLEQRLVRRIKDLMKRFFAGLGIRKKTYKDQ
ncbi:MAG: exostosin family protein [Candidatus Omnitrophica bacterium]|nr:exostosin family protein [Candidatus Omnitrophota bacterium]